MLVRKHDWPPERGAILIEIIISTALIGIVLVSIFLGLVTMNQFFRRSSQSLTATSKVANRLDELRSQSYDGLLLGVENQAVTTLPNGLLQTTITEPEVNLKEIVVLATWFEDGHSVRQVLAVTRVARDGLEAL